jgi:alkanesulfonate monooxygenase SsuD/methylene tetrahydromethanopterin reductase-like flavin-dependent oxidoreductase (luciferase family)
VPEFPIYIGALSPGMLRLAGEIADGVMLWLCTPQYVRDTVVPNLTEGCERAGRSLDGFEIVASIPTAVTDNAPRMRAALAKQVIHNLRLPFYRAMLERGGYGDDLKAIEEGRSFEDLFATPDPELFAMLGASRMLGDLAAIGTADEVRASLDGYANAGTTIAGINPVMIDDFDATLAAAAAYEMCT